jgi:hypothetical protein
MAIRDTHRESPRRFPLRRLLSAERALAAAKPGYRESGTDTQQVPGE